MTHTVYLSILSCYLELNVCCITLQKQVVHFNIPTVPQILNWSLDNAYAFNSSHLLGSRNRYSILYIVIAACGLCLCTVWLCKSEGKKQGFGTKSVFYVTVRSGSESRAWPIFRAPRRRCFCSMHWKPWLLLFITTLQSLRCIRRLSRGELTTHPSHR